ncbi:MAG: trans-sulfuration enzyme family protein [Candidatus Lutacidiplasmatales archaeon]
MRFDTKLIHGGQGPDPLTGAVNVPVYLSSTFAQSAPNRHKGYVYSRSANPTRTALESALAAVEEGAVGLAFSSGLGALATLLESIPSKSRIVADLDLYGGTWRLLEHHRRTFGVLTDYVDFTDLDRVRQAVATGPAPAMVYAESPTNPLLRVIDLAASAKVAHARRSSFVVDNTFASPALQRPLPLGADIVLHSTTKYLGGHSDVIGGALVVRSRARGEKLRWLQNAVGAVPSPFDSFLVLRGMHTLGIRMRAHSAGAAAAVEVLDSSRKVRAVHYPGLASHPQHAVAARQMSEYGGMVSFELAGGMPAVRRFLRKLRIFTLAESLGGVESLVDHPASMTHASVPRSEREAHGVTDGLVRLSCGIEDPADLADDLRNALGSL